VWLSWGLAQALHLCRSYCQQLRFANSQSDIICNADMRIGEVRQFCQLQPEVSEFDAGGDESDESICKSLCTAQCHRILKLARMIADLAGSEDVQSAHLAEALHASQSSEVDDGVTIENGNFVK